MSRGLDVSQDLDVARTLLDAYQRMAVEIEVMRSETALLPELIAIATVSDHIDSMVRHQSARLHKLEAARHRQARTAAPVVVAPA